MFPINHFSLSNCFNKITFYCLDRLKLSFFLLFQSITVYFQHVHFQIIVCLAFYISFIFLFDFAIESFMIFILDPYLKTYVRIISASSKRVRHQNTKWGRGVRTSSTCKISHTGAAELHHDPKKSLAYFGKLALPTVWARPHHDLYYHFDTW